MSLALLRRRLFGGSNLIFWRGEDVARLAKHYNATETDVVTLITRRDALAGSSAIPFMDSGESATPSESSAPYAVRLSGPTVDLVNDSLSLEWDLSDYRGVALWGHNADILPIGRGINVGIRGGWLRAGLVWSKSPFARAVRQQVDEGNLKGISVGFRPGIWEFSKTRPGGIDFLRGHKLLEFSAVNVAALPSAMFEGTGAKSAAAAIEAGKRQPSPETEAMRRRVAEIRARASRL
jgi:phage head maturation protease